MAAFILQCSTVNRCHGVEEHWCKIFHAAVIDRCHAKFICIDLKEVIRDSSVYDIRSVTVAEIMGRHAGWLTKKSQTDAYAR